MVSSNLRHLLVCNASVAKIYKFSKNKKTLELIKVLAHSGSRKRDQDLISGDYGHNYKFCFSIKYLPHIKHKNFEKTLFL